MTTDNTLGPPLTQAEVDALPMGTEIIVKWSGGNGPYEYWILRNPRPEANQATYAFDGVDAIAGKLQPVGEHPLTQVWRKS